MKRIFDITLAVLLIAIFCIPILLVALLVKLTSKGPALYWSDRVGKDNVLFKMPKFRSMRTDAPVVATHLMADPKQYLTPIGSFLRKSSLDELPQLWNILIGDMSFVGPRPALYNQIDLVELDRRASCRERV
jgi:O-antigen biosynthesis protein WbqP